MVGLQRERLTEEEYLVRENRAESKHEYVNGEVVAMAGGSLRHNMLGSNVIMALGRRLLGKPCRPTTSDQRVNVPETKLYTYPDVTVIGGPPEIHPKDRNTITNPRVIFEVLSSSTEAYDRGAKFSHYQRLASLAEYVLVAQRWKRVEHYRRLDGDQWILTVYDGSGDIELPALGCSIPLHEIYAGASDYPPDEDEGNPSDPPASSAV